MPYLVTTISVFCAGTILAISLRERSDRQVWHDLLTLAKPGIVAASALTGFVGMTVAAGGVPGTKDGLAVLTALILTAAGAALLNGILDAPLDVRMQRLNKRVSALNRVGKPLVALVAGLSATSGLLVAVCLLPGKAALLLAAAFFWYVAFYTIREKRRTPWAPVTGGVAGALPVLIGAAAGPGTIGAGPAILFVVMLLWQPPHFWALALAKQDDYRAAGIPTLPECHGATFCRRMSLVFCVLLLPASLLLSVVAVCSAWYALAALLLGVSHLLSLWRHLGCGDFRRAFIASLRYILLLFGAIVLDLAVIRPFCTPR